MPARISSASATPVAAARSLSFLFCSAVMKTCLRTILVMQMPPTRILCVYHPPFNTEDAIGGDASRPMRIVRAATLGHIATMQKKAAKPAVSKQAQPAGLRPTESFQDL